MRQSYAASEQAKPRKSRTIRPAAQSLHKYLYAENNPATYTDPSGQVVFIPVLLAVWAVAEVALQIYDTYDTLNTVFDPCVSLWEKGVVATLYVGGLFLPGGGYGTGGRAVLRHGDALARHGDDAYRFVRWGDEATDGARLLDTGDALARHGDDAEQIRVVDEVAKCFNSFSGATSVATADGPRPIREVQIGDRVWAYHETTNHTGLYTVTAVISHSDPGFVVLWLGGERLETTAEHPFSVLGRGWVEVEDLVIGDLVRQLDGTYAPVESITLVRRAQTMYNLTVASAHTFFVGEEGWLVHNTKRCTLRELYLGDTPSKSSATGKRVIDRMMDEGKIRLSINGEGLEVYHPKTGWVDISDTDMGHRVDAVSWWNEVGRFFGPKSEEVREFMLDPDNYELEPYWINRSKGSLLGKQEQYLPPVNR
jgi:Pretoxin HINT domain/HNH/ENDO VII superfamily nuclease with conserved GHE residues